MNEPEHHLTRTFKIVMSTAAGAALLPFVLFIQGPIDIYVNNLQEFTIRLGPIVMALLPFFALGYALVLLPLILPNSRFRNAYSSLVGAGGVLVWLTATFFFGNYGAFDGRGLEIEVFSLYSGAQILLWANVLFVLRPLHRRDSTIIATAAWAVLAVAALSTAVNVQKYRSSDVAQDNELSMDFSDEFLQFSTDRNVLHIVLDELQSTIFSDLLASNSELRQQFDGFTFYENTSAVFPTTIVSIPQLVSGIVYRNDRNKFDYLDDMRDSNPFRTGLDNAGFRSDYHTIFCGRLSPNCIPVAEGLDAGNVANRLVDMSLFRSVPDIVKGNIYNDERWFVTRFMSEGSYSESTTGIGHLYFEEFKKRIEVADVPRTYKFYHSLLTHSPFLLDADCKLRSDTDENLFADERFRAEALCGLGHVTDIMERLRQLGAYDNTMIILSSDHGSYYGTSARDGQGELNYRQTTAMSTLVIKPFDSRGILATSSAPVSLLDIPNTVLSALGTDLVPEGMDILSLEEDQPRVREYMHYVWAEGEWAAPKLPPLTVFEIRGDIRDPSAWTVIGPPQESSPYYALIDEGQAETLRSTDGEAIPMVPGDAFGYARAIGDEFSQSVVISGWAAGVEQPERGVTILIFQNRQLLHSGTPRIVRPDVAEVYPEWASLTPGYRFEFPLANFDDGAQTEVRIFALTPTGTVSELGYIGDTWVFPLGI